ESHYEKQPLFHGDLVITADARIDNRGELCNQFGIPLAERNTTPDSFLIVLAYERWGEDCAAHLLGDFAFAIWNKQTRTLFCARDHIGARPFYYYQTPQTFIFASGMRGLLAFSCVPRDFNEAEIAMFLRSAPANVAPDTFFQHVHKLPLAH